MGNDTAFLTAEQVINYLADNPDFFMDNPQALDSLNLGKSPEGTISLAQRQTERLQSKAQQLRDQLHALIQNAHQNTELQQRIHILCLRMMDVTRLDQLLPLLIAELKQEFNAEEVALRLFYKDQALALPEMIENIEQLHADDDSLHVFDNVLSKQKPVCGRLTIAQKTVLFPQQVDEIQSAACLPLGHEPCAGLLAIASKDPNHFHADMGTVYLAFLGEVLMRLIRSYCHPNYGK